MIKYVNYRNLRLIVMLTVENIQGREIISNLLNFNFPITAIIVEHKSKYSEKCRNYLQNDFYNPKSLNELVQDQKINVHYVEHHNSHETVALLKKYEPDYIVLGGTRILKSHIIKTAKYGVLNSHPAILPKYQGLDCVGWTILNGESVGATVHFIDEGVDTGAIIIQETIDYSDCKKLIEVRIKDMKKCAELVIKALVGLEFGSIKPKPQDLGQGIQHSALSPEKLELIDKIIPHATGF